MIRLSRIIRVQWPRPDQNVQLLAQKIIRKKVKEKKRKGKKVNLMFIIDVGEVVYVVNSTPVEAPDLQVCRGLMFTKR